MCHVPFWLGCNTASLFHPTIVTTLQTLLSCVTMGNFAWWDIRIEANRFHRFSRFTPRRKSVCAWADAFTATSAGREFHSLGTDARLSALNPRIPFSWDTGARQHPTDCSVDSLAHTCLRIQPGVRQDFLPVGQPPNCCGWSEGDLLRNVAPLTGQSDAKLLHRPLCWLFTVANYHVCCCSLFIAPSQRFVPYHESTGPLSPSRPHRVAQAGNSNDWRATGQTA